LEHSRTARDFLKNLLVIGPNAWDELELTCPRVSERNRVVFLKDPALEAPANPRLLDLLLGEKDLERLLKRHLDRLSVSWFDGVIGTDEYLACAGAAILSREWGLPGSSPRSILLCQHKYYSRVAQKQAVPEHVPGFTWIDPFRLREEDLTIGFPMFVKPVRASFSIFARRVESFAHLPRMIDVPLAHRLFARRLMEPFNRLLRRYADFERDANYLIGEQILEGQLVTAEALVAGGKVEIVGITDSEMFPGTMSFRRFWYPSRLPQDVQQRMAIIVERLVPALGLDWTLFNVELFYDASKDHIGILEINPRMAYQFADLYQKVEGFNSYDLQIALALGEKPAIPRRQGRHQVACSFVLRKFEDALLVRFPSEQQVARVRDMFPDARIRFYGKEGHRLSEEIGVESWRYALVNLGGDSREDLEQKFARAGSLLPFQFEPVARAAHKLTV